MLPQIVFVQNSVHLAGAQKSLSRLLSAPSLQDHAPCLLTGQVGWLTDFCDANQVPWVQLPFPTSRSLGGRLFKNHQFAKQAAKRLKSLLDPRRPIVVHTNDHPDSLLGQAVAHELAAIPIMTLRTPGMSQRDFEKYHCSKHKHLIAVGDQLFQKVRPWIAGQPPLTLVHNGITEDEILPPPSQPSHALEHVLVLGSIIPRKGWQDLIAALQRLEAIVPPGPVPEIHFLGDLLQQDASTTLHTQRLSRFKLNFLGVDPNYRKRLRQYALAIHPSRDESFGMAALECVAAGVPLLAAATGLIPEFIPRDSFLFQPEASDELASKLASLLSLTMPEIQSAFGFTEAHQIIRERFSTLETVRKLKVIYREHTASGS